MNLSGCCWCLVYSLFSLCLSLLPPFSLCPLSPFLSSLPLSPFLLIHFIPLAFPFLPTLPFSHLPLLPSLSFHSLSHSHPSSFFLPPHLISGLSGIAIICQCNPNNNSGHLGHIRVVLGTAYELVVTPFYLSIQDCTWLFQGLRCPICPWSTLDIQGCRGHGLCKTDWLS